MPPEAAQSRQMLRSPGRQGLGGWRSLRPVLARHSFLLEHPARVQEVPDGGLLRDVLGGLAGRCHRDPGGVLGQDGHAFEGGPGAPDHTQAPMVIDPHGQQMVQVAQAVDESQEGMAVQWCRQAADLDTFGIGDDEMRHCNVSRCWQQVRGLLRCQACLRSMLADAYCGPFVV
jgi:hypothetical protein